LGSEKVKLVKNLGFYGLTIKQACEL
jgi:hypothetical protein